MIMSLKIKRYIPYIVLFIILIVLMKNHKRHEKTYEVFIPNVEPQKVWDYLANYRNIVNLNKRIEHWKIVGEDTKSMHKWTYHVLTHEGLIGQFIFGANVNLGRIDVMNTPGPNNEYQIHGEYTTASFRGFIIIDNWSNMEMNDWQEGNTKGTLYRETVGMDCPLLFSFICSIETDRNRGDFLVNLKNAFIES